MKISLTTKVGFGCMLLCGFINILNYFINGHPISIVSYIIMFVMAILEGINYILAERIINMTEELLSHGKDL